MMFRENLPLFGLMVLLFTLFHEAGIAMGQCQYYNASSCGDIPNISPPFRLKGAPGECGSGDCCLELSCENNRTTLLADSGKYYVQEIDYVNHTIRLIDTSLDRNTCSFPRPFAVNSCISFYDDFYSYYRSYRFYIDKKRYYHALYFMNCTLPAVNLSLYDYVDVTRCVGNSSSAQTYFYAIFGNLTVLDIPPMSCTIEAVVETQFSNATGVSVSDIHQELLLGFELRYDWYDKLLCPRDKKKW